MRAGSKRFSNETIFSFHTSWILNSDWLQGIKQCQTMEVSNKKERHKDDIFKILYCHLFIYIIKILKKSYQC